MALYNTIIDSVATVAGCIAVGFGAHAIRQGNKNQEALIRERRIDFELGILKDLAEANADTGRTLRIQKMKMLVEMVPDAALAALHSEFGLYGSPPLPTESIGYGSVLTGEHRQQAHDELIAAIHALLAERGV